MRSIDEEIAEPIYRKLLIQEMQARVKSSNHQSKSMIVPAGKVFEELQEIIR